MNRKLKSAVVMLGGLIMMFAALGLMPGTTKTAKAAISNGDLYVAGKSLYNAGDTVGTETEGVSSGTARLTYENGKPVLTLTDFKYSGVGYLDADGRYLCAVYYKGTDELKIRLYGSNEINRTGDRGNAQITVGVYCCRSDLEFEGSGSLNVSDTPNHYLESYIQRYSASYAIVLDTHFDKKMLTVSSGTITATGGQGEHSVGVLVEGYLSVFGGTLTGKGSEALVLNGDHNSIGVECTYGISVIGGELIGEAGNATRYSIGIAVGYNDNQTLTVGSGGRVNGKSNGSLSSNASLDYGIFVQNGEAIIGDKGYLVAAGYRAINKVKSSVDGIGQKNNAAPDYFNSSENTLDLSEYKFVAFGTYHDHNFTYSASGNTITASCSSDGCYLADEKTALTINAPTLTVYGGTGSEIPLLENVYLFNGATGRGVTAADIKYYKATKNGDSYQKGDALAAVPTVPGDYVAEVTLTNVPVSGSGTGDVTASVGYTIARGVSSITTIPTASAVTYGQTLENSQLSGGAANTPGTFTWKDKTIKPKVSDSETTEYDVVFTPDDGYFDPAECKVSLTVNKKDISATASAVQQEQLRYDGSPKAPAFVVKDGETELVSGTDYSVKYESAEAPVNAGTYTANLSFDGNYTGTKKAEFTIAKAVIVLEDSQKPTAVTGLVADGTDKALVTAPQKAVPEGFTLQYAAGSDASAAPADGWGSTIPTGRDVGTYYAWYRVLGSDNYEDLAAQCLTVTIAEKYKEVDVDTHSDDTAPDATVEDLTEDEAESLPTEEEHRQIDDGAELRFYLEVKNIDQTAADEDRWLAGEAASEIPEGAQVGMYIELIFYKKVGDNPPVRVDDTAGRTMRVVLDMPERFRPEAGVTRTFYLARIDNGKAELVAEASGMTITLETDRFTKYAIIYSDVPENESFVGRVYRYLLDRPGDQNGMKSWQKDLVRKKITAANVVEGIIYSDEYVKKNKGLLNKNAPDGVFVDKVYLMILGRRADPAGRQYWVDKLQEGYSRKYVLAQIFMSDEFREFCKAKGYEAGSIKLTDKEKKPDPSFKHADRTKIKDYVTRLYLVILGRKPELAGLEYWVDEIAIRSKTPEWVAAFGFFESDEYLKKNKSARDFLTDCYATMMDRKPDEAGLRYWEERLSDGLSRTWVTSMGFGQSKEFGEILQSYSLK